MKDHSITQTHPETTEGTVTENHIDISHFGLVAETESLPCSFRCLRFFTSVLIRSLSLSRSSGRSARELMRRLRHMPAAATELSIASCIGRCKRTIFCIKWSGEGYIALGQAMRIANHHPSGWGID